MTTVVLAPLRDYQDGQFDWGPRSILDTDTSIAFSVPRCTTDDLSIWPNATTELEIICDQFVEGEWRTIVGARSGGGVLPGKNGGEQFAMVLHGAFFPGKNRQIKGSVTIVGGPLHGSASAEIV